MIGKIEKAQAHYIMNAIIHNIGNEHHRDADGCIFIGFEGGEFKIECD